MVGIVPSFPDAMLANASNAAQTELRAEVFHRFLLLLTRTSIDSCKRGVLINGRPIAARLLMLVCDQPQERMLVGLENVGSFLDCALCDIMTKVPVDKAL